MITAGEWKVSKNGGAIITNIPTDSRPYYTWEDKESEYDFYGGYMVCESIASKEDEDLISASKELLYVVEDLIAMIELRLNGKYSFQYYIKLKKLQIKACGYKFSIFYVIPALYVPVCSRIEMHDTHQLKILQPYFDLIKSGKKSFELIKNDRNYKIGDKLLLLEFNYPELSDFGNFTGNYILVRVDSILRNAFHLGLRDGYIIMSISLIK